MQRISPMALGLRRRLGLVFLAVVLGMAVLATVRPASPDAASLAALLTGAQRPH
jgi:hypothetical protein